MAKRLLQEVYLINYSVFCRNPSENIKKQWYDAFAGKFVDYEQIEEKLKDIMSDVSFIFLRSTKTLLNPEKTNSQSLVFKCEYKQKNILFTGDATGDSFDSCLYGYKTKDENEKEIVTFNRNIMKK